eukprot:gene6183-20715_t
MGRLQQYVTSVKIVRGYQRQSANGQSSMDSSMMLVELKALTGRRRNPTFGIHEMKNDTVARPTWLQNSATPEVLVSYDSNAYRKDVDALEFVFGRELSRSVRFRVVCFGGARRELSVQVKDLGCVQKWSSLNHTVVPVETLTSSTVRHYKVFTRADAMIDRTIRLAVVLDRFRGKEEEGIYVKSMTGDKMGAHLIVGGELPANVDVNQLVCFSADKDSIADFPIAGVEPRGRRREDVDRYSASGQTINFNDRFVAPCSKVRLGVDLFPKPSVAEAFPMVTRVAVDVQANDGLIEEVSEFLMCMGHNASTKVLGTRRKRVIATDVEPVAAAVLAGMSMQLSAGPVVFSAGEQVQIRAAQAELCKVAPLSEWRAKLVQDAEEKLIRRWGGRVSDGPPDTDSDDGRMPAKPKGTTGPAPPQQAMVKIPAGRGHGLNVSASAAAASPDRQEKLVGKAVEAAMRKARDLGGLDQQKLADLEKAMLSYSYLCAAGFFLVPDFYQCATGSSLGIGGCIFWFTLPDLYSHGCPYGNYETGCLDC